MFKSKWSLVIKAALWCTLLFAFVLILAGYMFMAEDPGNMGLGKLLAIIIVVFSLILLTVVLGISFLISLLRIADKKTKGKVSSGRNKLALIYLLLIIIILATGIVWYRSHDPYYKEKLEYYEIPNEYNSWQASVHPLEIKSKSLK